jgi:hypothetical protein
MIKTYKKKPELKPPSSSALLSQAFTMLFHHSPEHPQHKCMVHDDISEIGAKSSKAKPHHPHSCET